MKKRLMSLMLAVIIMVIFCVPTYARETGCETQQIILDGTTYSVTQSQVGEERIVNVVGGALCTALV